MTRAQAAVADDIADRVEALLMLLGWHLRRATRKAKAGVAGARAGLQHHYGDERRFDVREDVVLRLEGGEDLLENIAQNGAGPLQLPQVPMSVGVEGGKLPRGRATCVVGRLGGRPVHEKKEGRGRD